jgi:hypothetical protein
MLHCSNDGQCIKGLIKGASLKCAAHRGGLISIDAQRVSISNKKLNA